MSAPFLIVDNDGGSSPCMVKVKLFIVTACFVLLKLYFIAEQPILAVEFLQSKGRLK